MFRHDAARTGHASFAPVGRHVVEKWRVAPLNTTEYGAVKGSPVVANDVLYCGTDRGTLYAVRAEDGAVVWTAHIVTTTHGIHGTPAVIGDAVYVGAYNGTTYAFDRATGYPVWTHSLGYQIGSSPAVVPQWGMLFTANEASERGGGDVVALDARTGAEMWRHPVSAHPHSSVAVDEERETVFVGDNHGWMHALRARTGDVAWERRIEGTRRAIKTTPTVLADRHRVVFGAWTGHVYALDEATGDTLWDRAIGGSMMGSAAYAPGRGLVYVGTPRGELWALDADDGSVAWAVRVHGAILSSPTVSGDERGVVFGAANGFVYALDAGTGEKMWRHHVGGEVSGSPALVGRRIYVTSKKGGLVALETSDE